jgi:5S rRNA maturation endonuclease (ribonuclease M5)
VTEGGFKALAIERADPTVALAATSGSAIMPGYPIALHRFKHVIVSTDADDTGDRIADELMFMLRRQRVAHTRMRLRDKTDHDEIEIDELRELLRWARAGRVA